ncbi:MAG: YceI family protein [Sediminicola sp.]
MKRPILYLISFLGLLSFAPTDSAEEKQVEISPESRLVISGSSNVNKFKCGFNAAQLTKPITIEYSKQNGKLLFNKAVLPLYNGYFDCGGRAINRDFMNLLKSSEHPKIQLSLLELQLENLPKGSHTAKVSIEIAGMEKSYSISIQCQGTEKLCVSGKLLVNLNDFDLEAPKKAFGLIVISDVVEIDFDLIIETD